ncbi:non-specific lipid transfer protein GPI-anchored 11-like [Diospyros lotus]|uniref:non-specific lipid transfer protein GPI-anchored 11-like n=1 Tax=Diospyros lotus TaxID=55363 RepID=UPI002254A212|nr:non-specific lipid transfer protein GPI-anchored 11-like [Diospyros lotus]
MAAGKDLSNSPTPSPFPSPSMSPAPSEYCSTLIYNMVDCVTYLAVGSKDTEPEPSCCAGLKEVVSVDAECICEALQSSIDLGFAIDMNKALSLPSACSLSVPNLSTCNPNPSPLVPEPASAPESPIAPAPGSGGGGGGAGESPASSPVNSGVDDHSSAVHYSFLVLMLFLYFCSYYN